MKTFKALSAAAVIATGLGLATPASAGTGCNGVVNIFQWGCAPWDNNNGPQYPYFKKKTVKVAGGTPAMQKDGRWFAQVNGQWAPIIAAGGGNIVAAGAGNVIAPGGANVVVSLPAN